MTDDEVRELVRDELARLLKEQLTVEIADGGRAYSGEYYLVLAVPELDFKRVVPLTSFATVPDDPGVAPPAWSVRSSRTITFSEKGLT